MDLPRVVTGRVFFDQALDLTGLDLRDCVFDGCVLTCWRSSRRMVMRGCMMTNCRLVGDAWPPEAFRMGVLG